MNILIDPLNKQITAYDCKVYQIIFLHYGFKFFDIHVNEF